MRMYKDIDLDYGENTPIIEEYERRKKEEELAAKLAEGEKATDVKEGKPEENVIADSSDDSDDDMIVFYDSEESGSSDIVE